MQKTAQSRILVAAILAVAWLSGPGGVAQTPTSDGAYGDDYRSGDFGRVRSADNGLTIVRAEWEQADGAPLDAGVNSPVFPGDTVSAAADQRVEVQLAGGTLVWIDRSAELTFLALPDPYAEFADNTVLQLAVGRVRLATVLGRDEEFRVDTPSSTIYPLGEGEFRIDVGPDGSTRVVSRRGVAEVVGSEGSVILRGGTATDVFTGSLPDDPVPVNTFAGDSFDRWVSLREEQYEVAGTAAGQNAYEDLPYEVKPYYRELSTYGTWVDTADYGYVWQPAGVAGDWRPYYHGYWSYGPRGYFWVSPEPWGWAPYHYGRWDWISGFGWCWIPGRVFGGAWVAWSWGSVYVGWSPLNYWNYPAYYGPVYYGYYDPHCWTFLSYQHIHHHHHHYDYAHYAVPYDQVKHDVGHSAVVTRPPRVSPRGLSESRESRQAALREARQDRRGRIAPAEERRARRSSFREIEVARSEAVGRPRIDARRGETSGPVSTRGAPRSGGSAGSRATGRDRLPVVSTPRYPRQLSTGRPSAKSPGERSGARRGVRDPQAEPLGTSERLRDIYRKMAQPRQTRVRPEGSGSKPEPTAEPESRSRPSKGTSAKPRARPKSSGGESDSKGGPPSQRSKPTPSRAKPKPRGGDDNAQALSPGPSRGRGGVVRSARSTPSAQRRTGASTVRSTRVTAPAGRSGSRGVRSPSPPAGPSAAARSNPSPVRPPTGNAARPQPVPTRARAHTPARSGGGPQRVSTAGKRPAGRSPGASRSGGGGSGKRAGGRPAPSRKSSGGSRKSRR